jgi:uncharacterized RDD family membrane protein YckC
MNAAPPAGFWIRAIALVIDLLVLMVVQSSYELIASLLFGADADRSWGASGTVFFFTIVFFALYSSVLHAAGGQTLGKLVTRVRVVTLDGDLPQGGAAFLRWLAYFLSFATFGLGFVMAGLRSDKRALHDLIAGTRVERVPPLRRRALIVEDEPETAEPPAPASSTPPAIT